MSRRSVVVSGVIIGTVLFVALAVWYRTAVLRGRGNGPPPLKYLEAPDGLSSGSTSATTPIPEMLRMRVGELSHKEQTTYEWVRELQSRGFRICVEDIRRRPLERKINQFELRGNQELVQVLHDITQNDYRYRWDYVRGTDVINVVPINNSHLATPMDTIRFHNRPLAECLGHPILLEKAKIYHATSGARGPGNMAFWPMRLNMNNGTVRDYLNRLVRQYEGMTWSINCVGVVSINSPEEVRTKVSDELKRKADQKKANQQQTMKSESADISK